MMIGVIVGVDMVKYEIFKWLFIYSPICYQCELKIINWMLYITLQLGFCFN
jgi:hypothetical protein